MTSTVEDMAERQKKEETETVRVAKSVARKARMLAAASDQSLPDYLSEKLREVVDREWRKVVESESGKPPRRS